MSAFEFEPERALREQETAEAFEEAPSKPFPWFVGGDRCFGVLPGDPSGAQRLAERGMSPCEPTLDRDALDRLAEGFVPMVEGTFSVRLLIDLLDAFDRATRKGHARLSVGSGGYLRLFDPITGTVGFLGPIVEAGGP